jgi:TP901 family phage tail tape measure protein
MGLEQIGLEAIFKNADFLAGMREYLAATKTGKDETESAGARMTEGLSRVGGAVVMGALGAAAAAVGTLAGAALAAIPAMMGWAGTVDSIGDVLGTSAEESSALAVAIQRVGGNVEGITGQMAFLTRGLVDSKGELGATGAVMDKLGIAFRDANGNILPSTDIITAVADKLALMPDGLEKTKLMVELFGKSGKDLTDTLGALTTDGFAEADAMAKELGLSLSGDTVDGSIELQKQLEFLKMAGQGLFVQLGKELMPAVMDLAKRFMELARKALPKVREILPQIAGLISRIANVIITAMPIAFNILQAGFNWLMANKPIIVGVLAAIAVAVAVWAYTTIAAAIPAIVAMVTAAAPLIGVLLLVAAVVAALAYAWENNFLGMRDALTQFWEGTVRPALQQLWNWLAVNVPAAIEILKGFWEETLLPAIMSVWEWIQANLFPLFQTMWDWLATNIPLAIESLRAFWEDTLLPAIQRVWTWMTTVLFPFFQSFTDFLGAVFGLALEELGKVWTETLLPALTEVWKFISETLFPLLTGFGDWLSQTFGPLIEDAAKTIRDVLGRAFEWASGKLQDLTKWFNNLVRLINGARSGPASDPPGTCFVASTPVNVPGGMTMIADLRVGDKVLLMRDDGEQVAALVAKTIHSVRSDLVSVYIDDGRQYHCSPNHRFKTFARGWVEACDLAPGEMLVSKTPAFVAFVEAYPGEFDIYNIEVDHPDHTYLVDGVVVHNAKSPGAGSQGAGVRGSAGSFSSMPSTPAMTRSTTINNAFNFGGNNINSALDFSVLEARIEQVVARAVKA